MITQEVIKRPATSAQGKPFWAWRVYVSGKRVGGGWAYTKLKATKYARTEVRRQRTLQKWMKTHGLLS